MVSGPILSICVPTRNRADFLRVMLETLVPQVGRLEGQVELWVSDNASTDTTRQVVENAARLGPIKYSRNDSDIGAIANVVKAASQLATGEFVWLLGDHNLLSAGGLERAVGMLRQHPELDLFYLNFRCAAYPTQWPVSSLGGFDGAYEYLAWQTTESRRVDHWNALVDSRSSMATQLYAHIVRTTIWRDFWAGRPLPEQYMTAISTYPHTVMIASTMFEAPCYYLGEPIITIFNGAQSWGFRLARAKVILAGLPDLLDLYAAKGLPRRALQDARKFAEKQAYLVWLDLFMNFRWRHAATLLGLAGPRFLGHRYTWSVSRRAYMDAQVTSLSRLLRRLGRAANKGRVAIWPRSAIALWVRSKFAQPRAVGDFKADEPHSRSTSQAKKQ